MQRDIYVPFSAVSNVTGSRVVLTLPAGDVDDQGWENPPLMGSTAA